MSTKPHFQQLIIQNLYSARILNNSHRGDLVEIMVLSALGPDWRHVGLGWNLWDLQRGNGPDRVRIQVKQSAARQLWGKTKEMTFRFPWSEKVPNYFFRDNPEEAIESSGWFCDLFVVGLHIIDDDTCDQMDVNQWKFMVVPTNELPAGRRSMPIERAVKKWPPVSWQDLRAAVEVYANRPRAKIASGE